MQNVIVETGEARRKEAASIGFKPLKGAKAGDFPERVYGSNAVALAERVPGNVYTNLKTLLGLPADNTVVKSYAALHPALKLESDKTRGTAAFRSGAFADEEEPWTVEELLAMQLQRIQKNAETLAGKGSTIEDIVLTVPVFYTAEEKRAVLLAADLAGLRVLELVSDGLAVGLHYATGKKFPSINEGGKAEVNMIFDMGAGSTKASILKFQGRTVKDVGKYNKTIQEVLVMGSGWDRTLGGDALNAVILDDMITKFVASPKAQKISATAKGVRAHGQAMAKLSKQAERVRQVLSANPDTSASFEELYEDINFKYTITRAEFEEMSVSYAARIGETIQKAVDAAGLEVTDLDSIILHGGATRTPFVLKELEKIVGNAEKLRTNVNADEAAVFGAGFRGATLNPFSRTKEIKAFDGAAYAGGIKWTNILEKPQHQRLWKPNALLGRRSDSQYTFKNQEDFKILFYQHVPGGENVTPGSAEKELLTLRTQNLTVSTHVLKEKFGCTDGDINLKLNSRLSATNGEVDITSLVLECEVEDVEKAGVVDSVKNMFGFGGKKDQEPLAEDSTESGSSTSTLSSSTTKTKSSKDSKKTKEVTKPTKHFEKIPIAYTTTVKGYPQLPIEEVTRMKERISAFAGSDLSRKLRDDAMVDLASFASKVRDFLKDDDFMALSTTEERSNLKAKGDDAYEWVSTSEGLAAPREVYEAKLKGLKDITGPIEIRKKEASSLPAAIKKLEAALNATKHTISSIQEQIENDTKTHASWSSSKLAASSSPTPSPSPVDDFADLEDEATETTSAPVEEETLDPPTYNAADLIRPQDVYSTISEWFADKLPKQQALKPTDDPVILTKDVAAKAKQLEDIQVDLLMKSMKRPQKSSRPPVKPKPKSKSKKAKSSKTASGEEAGATLNVEELMKDNFLKMGEDGGMPGEEEIKAFLEKQQAKEDAAEGKTKEPVEEVKSETEKPHDEL